MHLKFWSLTLLQNVYVSIKQYVPIQKNKNKKTEILSIFVKIEKNGFNRQKAEINMPRAENPNNKDQKN